MAATAMTCKERILGAMRRQDVDYAPCMPIWWSWSSPTVNGYRWTSTEERVKVLTGALGIDTYLDFNIPPGRHPEISESTWEEVVPEEQYPLLHKVIETPAGELRATVRRTPDWPHGEDIPLMSDFVVSRLVKPWIENEQDLDCLEYVWQPPPDCTDGELERRIAPIRRLAEEWQLPVRSTVGQGLTASLSLFGASNAPVISLDKPELLERLLGIEHRTTMKRIELAARAGVDFVTRNGFYETTDFWSPSQIEYFLSERLRLEIETSHQAGLLITYTVCTGIMPILAHLKSLPFDCLFGIEPVLGDQDMALIARELGSDKCIWGGLSAPMHLGMGRPETVRAAVRSFYRDFGRRGTILAPVPSIRQDWPWENVIAMVEEWKEINNSPPTDA